MRNRYDKKRGSTPDLNNYDHAVVLYINRIRDLGGELTPKQRSFVLSVLEGLVSYANGGESFRGQEGELVKIKFNVVIARQLRERAGLSQEALGVLLGYKDHNTGCATVCGYETGAIPLNPESQAHRKYVLWLKEQGYDPFKKLT